jgi:hypothetical protein
MKKRVMPCYGEMLTLLSCFKARGVRDAPPRRARAIHADAHSVRRRSLTLFPVRSLCAAEGQL